MVPSERGRESHPLVAGWSTFVGALDAANAANGNSVSEHATCIGTRNGATFALARRPATPTIRGTLAIDTDPVLTCNI